ncbi:hypothetical protein NPX13_g1900 [Xylaria arbuscula]|uniref:Rhodopsin domain-containing protein n=1 Tax=Xylaria arbuscula TaxID=114810 RepID=A0A9W8TQW7_9PEZI|nr:hypothetical protein NPX13_g1900 [Xylaria arbuscula]
MDPDKPALAPPPGIQSNFDNPPNENVQAHIGIAICIFIVFVGGSLRAYSKIVCMKQVRLEDYVGLVALAPYIAFIYGVYNLMQTVGIYVHQWNVRASEAPAALYIVYVNTSLFQATMATIKSAILLEWMHIFVPHGTKTNHGISSVVFPARKDLAPDNAREVLQHQSALRQQCHVKPSFGYYHPRTSSEDNMEAQNVDAEENRGIPCICCWGDVWIPKSFTVQLKYDTDASYSATLVGGARLARAVIYYLSNDNIYNVSAVFLWCTAELSTSFLVFCLPAIPKIFSSDNWISQLASRLQSRLSFLKTRTTNASGNRKASTWKSSAFSGGSTSEAGWDQPPHLAYEQHGFVSYYADPNNPNAIRSYVHYNPNLQPPGPYYQAPWPSVPSVAMNRHNPTTSWYEEGP